MFDLRYHVASLAAVFIALVIGILVGVGISGRGLLEDTEREVLEERIGQLEAERDALRLRAEQARALEVYERETYAAVMAGRLLDHRVGVVFVGSPEGEVAAAIRETLDRADGTLARLRALKVPIATGDLLRNVADLRDAPQTVEDLGRGLAEELVDGGQSPLWEAVGPLLVAEREGGADRPLDGIVVARTTDPQRGQTARFLAGFYAGLAAAGVPVVGVETLGSPNSAIPTFRSHGFSSVDHVDTAPGRVALAVLLDGDARGAYGLGDGADDVLPTVEPLTATG